MHFYIISVHWSSGVNSIIDSSNNLSYIEIYMSSYCRPKVHSSPESCEYLAGKGRVINNQVIFSVNT